MNKNEKFVITINREVGSGGRTIGEIMAAKLGVTFYDKGVIDALCKKYNLSVKEIESLKGASTTGGPTSCACWVSSRKTPLPSSTSPTCSMLATSSRLR